MIVKVSIFVKRCHKISVRFTGFSQFHNTDITTLYSAFGPAEIPQEITILLLYFWSFLTSVRDIHKYTFFFRPETFTEKQFYLFTCSLVISEWDIQKEKRVNTPVVFRQDFKP